MNFHSVLRFPSLMLSFKVQISEMEGRSVLHSIKKAKRKKEKASAKVDLVQNAECGSFRNQSII